jgi:hypothetical protein
MIDSLIGVDFIDWLIQCRGGLYPDGAVPKKSAALCCILLSHRGLISQVVKSPWPNSHHHNCTPKYSICHMNGTSEGIMGFHLWLYTQGPDHWKVVAFPARCTWPRVGPVGSPRFFTKTGWPATSLEKLWGSRVSYGYPDVFFAVTSERRKKKHTWLWFLDVPPSATNRSPSSDPIRFRQELNSQWIGWRENLQETMVFTIKYRRFRLKFSHHPILWNRSQWLLRLLQYARVPLDPSQSVAAGAVPNGLMKAAGNQVPDQFALTAW